MIGHDERATEAAIIGLIVIILALLLIMSENRLREAFQRNGHRNT